MWKVIDRNDAVVDEDAAPLLSDAIKEKIASFFPRYETKRAALLPALHLVQEAHGHVDYSAMKEIADLLDINPSDVLDVVSFYTHFCTHSKGKKTVMICRSLSCELMGGKALLEAVKDHLGVVEHGSTLDGRYYLMTEECLAACDYAPCMMVNEKMHKRVTPEEAIAILRDPHNDQLPMPRSDLFDPPAENGTGDPQVDTTSDVQE